MTTHAVPVSRRRISGFRAVENLQAVTEGRIETPQRFRCEQTQQLWHTDRQRREQEATSDGEAIYSPEAATEAGKAEGERTRAEKTSRYSQKGLGMEDEEGTLGEEGTLAEEEEND